MRAMIMTGLMLASLGAPARNMFLVIHTQDTEVIEYRRNCSNDLVGEGMVVRRVVRVQGHLSWHVVGGVAPYTVINGVPDELGNLCVTVIDAAGNVASGHGVICTQVTSETVGCPDAVQEEPVVPKVSPTSVPVDASVRERARGTVAPRPPVDRERYIERKPPERTTTTSRSVVTERVAPTPPPGRSNPVERQQVPRK
ncbi:MAG: hypothetical protein ABI432_19005 [Flavobacteriales bacterium]